MSTTKEKNNTDASPKNGENLGIDWDKELLPFKGRIIKSKGDGNCLVNAFCQHLHGKATATKAAEQRKAIVDYTITHRDEIPWRSTHLNDWKQPLDYYYRDGEWLIDDHVEAWQLLNGRNVVVFFVQKSKAYVRSVSKNVGRNAPVCGLLHRINHYDYVELPQDMEFIEKQMGLMIGKYDKKVP